MQVYYSAPDGVLDRPYQELAGFAKTKELQPGEQEEVTVSFTTESMAGYDMARAAIYWKPEFTMYASETVREIRISQVQSIWMQRRSWSRSGISAVRADLRI